VTGRSADEGASPVEITSVLTEAIDAANRLEAPD
jgi:hypothetical protein